MFHTYSLMALEQFMWSIHWLLLTMIHFDFLQVIIRRALFHRKARFFFPHEKYSSGAGAGRTFRSFWLIREVPHDIRWVFGTIALELNYMFVVKIWHWIYFFFQFCRTEQNDGAVLGGIRRQDHCCRGRGQFPLHRVSGKAYPRPDSAVAERRSWQIRRDAETDSR